MQEFFQRAKVRLLLDQPFFGTLALHLTEKIVDKDHPFFQGFPPTVAVDGKNLWINPEWVSTLTEEEKQGLLAHEVMHVCFPPGEIVNGAWVGVEHVCENMGLVGRGGSPTAIVETMERQYSGSLVTLKARGMLSLRMTEDHPVLTSRCSWKTIGPSRGPGRQNVRVWDEPVWKSAKDITEDDWLFVPKTSGHVDTRVLNFGSFIVGNHWSVSDQLLEGVPLNEDTARLFGWYVAEGHTTETPNGYQTGFSLGYTERVEADWIGETLQKYFGVSGRVVEKPERSAIIIHSSSSVLGRFLQQNFGHGAKSKRIPDFILGHTDERILIAFLQGYISGDGYVTDTVSFGTASKVLALQLQSIFARLGVFLSLFKTTSKSSVIQKTGQVIPEGTLFVGRTTQSKAFALFGHSRNVQRETHHFGELDGHFMVKVSSVQTEQYDGSVYNFETSCHTYTVGNLVVHNCLGHIFPWRRKHRDGTKWNKAGDHVINLMLKDENMKLPAGGLWDQKFKDRSTEDVYTEMEDEDENSGDKGGNGSKGGNGGLPWRDVMDAPDTQETKALEQDWKDRVVQSAMSAKMRGKLPAGIERLVDDLVNPTIPWAQILSNFLNEVLQDDYDMSRSDRRYIQQGIYLPDLYSEGCTVAIGVDTSGSIGMQEILFFVSECMGILKSRNVKKVRIMSWDTKVHLDETLDPWDELPNQYPGGGGSDSRCVFKRIHKGGQLEKPACLIILTDMYISFPSHAPNYPVVWVTQTDINHIEPPFGTVIQFNPEKGEILAVGKGHGTDLQDDNDGYDPYDDDEDDD